MHYGNFYERGDAYTSFVPNESKESFPDIQYEDRILLKGVFDKGYSLMTGTDSEHFEIHETPSAATAESLPGTVITDSWTNARWRTSKRLFMLKSIWEGMGLVEQCSIICQDWDIYLAESHIDEDGSKLNMWG